MKLFYVLSILLFLLVPFNLYANPTTEILESVSKYVYEVVVKKVESDSIKYEKELPLHLIPFSIRKDEYYSIGSAFAMGEGKFISAAHVINLYQDSQYKQYFIRDKDENVYELDKVYKYSNYRDFIVFSAKGISIDKAFDVNLDADQIMNKPVYSVGNALGEGIVLRNGMLTSKTYEDEAGKWKWLRFSAAASPGNSGGPLLDSDGKLLGVISMKSPNENLNYALPIKEVFDAPPNRGEFHTLLKYVFPNMSSTTINLIQTDFELPQDYQTFWKTGSDFLQQSTSKMMNAYLKSNKDNIFPGGKGSDEIMFSRYSAVFPYLIGEGRNKIWDLFKPDKIERVGLSKDGYIKYGNLGLVTFALIQKQSDMELSKIYNDSKYYMDYFLSAIPVNRAVQSEQVRITSLGKAHFESVFNDAYQRKWIIRTYKMPHVDGYLITCSLPLPNGMFTLSTVEQSSQLDSLIADLKLEADFIYISYNAKLEEWREYFNLKEYLPEIFEDMNFSYDQNRLSLSTKELNFVYDNKNSFVLADDSFLYLKFGFNKEIKDKWTVIGYMLSDDQDFSSFYSIDRHFEPHEDVSSTHKLFWKRLSGSKYPFDMSINRDRGYTIIKKVLARKDSSIYSLGMHLEGKKLDDYVIDKFNRIQEYITVK